MSDLNIPGLNSKYDTQKIIKALMDVKRVPLENMKKDVEEFKDTKEIWHELNLKLSQLSDSAKKLFDYQNPFNNRIAKSSDETVLTATATREATEDVKKVIVRQLATADRFISKSLDKDFKVEAGTYGFKVGDEEVKFRYSGGTLKNFVETINKKADKILKAQVINDTKSSQVIIIEAKETGSKNKLSFLDKSIDFGMKAGIIESTYSTTREVNLNSGQIQKWDKNLDKNAFSVTDKALTINPGNELKIPISPTLSLNRNMVLEYQLSVENVPEEEITAVTRPTGPDAPDAGKIELEGIVIHNEKTRIIAPDWEEPPPPEKIVDMQVVHMGAKGKIIPLAPIQDKSGPQKITVNIGQLSESIDGLYLRNRNTYKKITISDIKIYDPSVRGDYKVVNPLSESNDAVMELDGVKVTRGKNEIDDLIQGVVLNLHDTNDKPINLSIEKDVESIKNTIITFVGHYNQLLTKIDVLSRKDENVVNSIDYLTDEEREKAFKELGSLQGEMTLLHLKSSAQTIMMNPYKSDTDNEIRLLAQIGISTNTGKPGVSTSLDKTRLRGYLEIDEDKLQDAIIKNGDKIKQLFGYDTDKDFIVDSGLAFTLGNMIKPYITTGGILSIKNSTLDTKITERNKQITDYTEYLKDYERRLKSKYMTMEGLLGELEKNSQALQNFSNANNK
ncbi:MAG: flagellar filament capping protein FliD [Spirochaetales bacterium]|nr:flagellar filament capping protein FliD [Spirochaetales bacterium]